jgi:hypothetical protein
MPARRGNDRCRPVPLACRRVTPGRGNRRQSRRLACADCGAPSRARPLLPIHHVAIAACGKRVLGSCPDGPGGERGGGTSGGGGSSWAGCVCRGPAKTAQRGFSRTPLHAGKSRRREEIGTGFASGDAKPAVCQRLLCEHARAAATRHDEPWRRGGEGLAASSTRDLCRTLPPRATAHFTLSVHMKTCRARRQCDPRRQAASSVRSHASQSASRDIRVR